MFGAIVAGLAVLSVGGFLAWSALKPRSALGGPCSAAMDCMEGAERCLKSESSTTGICTKSCANDAECGLGLVCKRMEIVEWSGTSSTARAQSFCAAP